MRKRRERVGPLRTIAILPCSASATFTYRISGETVVFARDADAVNLVLLTAEFADWLDGVIDRRTSARIAQAVAKMRRGLFGDWKDLQSGVSEVRLDFGPGYRVYFARKDSILVVLLVGGDKSRQDKDIRQAVRLWTELRDEIEEIRG